MYLPFKVKEKQELKHSNTSEKLNIVKTQDTDEGWKSMSELQ